MTTTSVPRVWVGCRGCYNSGRLVGVWFDATDDYLPTDGGSFRALMGAGLPIPASVTVVAEHIREGHEELWVMDHENFHGALTDECSPVEAQRIATALVEAADNGTPMEAVGAYVGNVGLSYVDWDTLSEDVQDAYCGEYANGADYAQELAEDVTPVALEGKPVGLMLATVWPYTCIDWDRAWRELELGDGMWTHPTGNGTVYVFRSL
jgi:antirestriction protein